MTIELESLIAEVLHVMTVDTGFISHVRNPKQNTYLKVMAVLARPKRKVLEISYNTISAEIASFFTTMDTHPEYPNIMRRDNAALYQQAMEIAKASLVQGLDLNNLAEIQTVVMMPHLLGVLQLKKNTLDPKLTEAKLVAPGHHMGTLHSAGRFFVKLVHVSDEDPVTKATTFKVQDRNENVGFILERIDKFAGSFRIGDCFAMHAIPIRHVTSDNGENQTVFRGMEIISGTLVPRVADPANQKYIPAGSDQSSGGMFSKGVGF